MTLHSEEHRTWRRVLNDCTTLPPFYPSHGKALVCPEAFFFLPRSFPHQPGFPLLFPRLGVETEGDPPSSSSPNLISKPSLIDFRLIFQNVLFEELIKRGIEINDDRIEFWSFNFFDFQEFLKMIEMFILFKHSTLNNIRNWSFEIFFLLSFVQWFFFLQEFLDFSIRQIGTNRAGITKKIVFVSCGLMEWRKNSLHKRSERCYVS